MTGFYQIYLRDVEVSASIGIHGFERTARQPLLVSAAILLPEAESRDDDIAAVVDYDFVRDTILSLTAERHWELQESLCSAVAEACMQRPGVLGVIVRTEKPTVYPETKAVGCRIARLSDALPADFAWWSIHV